ncbi:hypothetical protein NDU88_008075 [Pleurodeles waltl]|uniref:Uncharacterized protein n=1 Tax=Pleurodeles waltl TaxID=8319 RepID=A0AAV7NC19_PLEWA|nr:hypothetical protein NDU88_008075 [Pleurodeles waltl]
MDNRLENAHSYAEYKALAPMMMDDLTHLIQVFRHGGGKLYHGIKVIFDFRWEEFTTLTERPPNFGSYDVRIQFGTSPTSAVPAQEILKKVGAADPWRAHRIALGTEVRQTLLLFRRKSKKILRGLQRLETERQLSCSGKKSKGHSSSGNKDGTPGESNAKQQTAKRLKPAASSPRTLEMVCSNVQLIHQAGGSCLSFSLTNSAPKAAVPCIPPPNHERDAMIAWTKNKMQELIRHFEEEKDTSKAKGHVKPLVFRHYIEKRKPSARARVQPMSMSPGVSAARMANMAPTSKVRTPRKDKMPKFLVALPDGAIFI